MMTMLQTAVDEEKFIEEKLAVPIVFPKILKDFTKAAIRTQPYDLLRWSRAYFEAFAHGEVPPVKERLEFPPIETESGLTPGYLRVLNKQLGIQEKVSVSKLEHKWTSLCLKQSSLLEIVSLLPGDEGRDELKWLQFLAVAAGHIGQSPLRTMIEICEILTAQPEGASACIPLTTFEPLYQLIAILDVPAVAGIGATVQAEVQDKAIKYFRETAEEQAGFITPRNLLHFSCPKLF